MIHYLQKSDILLITRNDKYYHRTICAIRSFKKDEIPVPYAITLTHSNLSVPTDKIALFDYPNYAPCSNVGSVPLIYYNTISIADSSSNAVTAEFNKWITLDTSHGWDIDYDDDTTCMAPQDIKNIKVSLTEFHSCDTLNLYVNFCESNKTGLACSIFDTEKTIIKLGKEDSMPSFDDIKQDVLNPLINKKHLVITPSCISLAAHSYNEQISFREGEIYINLIAK